MPERYQLVLGRPAGFFSNVFSVLGALEWCGPRGLIPAVRFDSEPYLDRDRGQNWWEYFFARLSDVDPMTLPVRARGELLERATFFAFYNIARRQTAAEVIRRHLVIQPHVTQGLDAFWSERIGGHFAVGLHLRGTDKFLERARPALEPVFAQIEQVVRGRTTWRLFVATDDLDLLQQAKEHFGAQVVCRDTLRSEDGQPLHLGVSEEAWNLGPNRDRPFVPMVRRPGFRIGLEALQDALLLARSDVFFGSSSCLSYFVGAFNPTLPWIHIDRSLPPWTEEREEKDALISALRAKLRKQSGLAPPFWRRKSTRYDANPIA